MAINDFSTNFDIGSILPSLLFLSGFITLYLFSVENYSLGNIALMISFGIYITNNIIVNYFGGVSVFNEYLDDLAAYFSFCITTVVFGLLYLENTLLLFLILFLYAISQLLSLSRNWIIKVKNSMGWPIALNGIFFPFCFYLVVVLIEGFAEGIFLLYYVFVAVLSVSDKNFLGYTPENQSDLE